MRHLWIASIVLAGVAVGGCHSMTAPKMPSYAATLAPGAGITSTGKGAGTFTYDPAMAAHIHGPADPGANAPPVVPFAAATSPISGTATLTDAQAADLAAGKYYVNVHTAANRGGEIRGQIVAK